MKLPQSLYRIFQKTMNITSENIISTEKFNNLSHYQIRACIGEGGQGEVFEAWDAKLCRQVAIKRIKGNASQSALREARMAASLQHAAFVKIHAIEDDGLGQSIVMELVPGATLKTRMADGPAAEAQAFDWVDQIAAAMQAAHASGLAHGDLKPSNVMVEPGGQIRILDFGLASKTDPLATTTLAEVEPRGTIAYMAPERLHGAPPGPQSDIYALGVMLYEMLCGARPFAHLNGLALAAAQAQTSSDAWDYPPAMQSSRIGLIRAMTARAPAQRLKDMRQVRERLAALAHDGQAPAARSWHLPSWPVLAAHWLRGLHRRGKALPATAAATLQPHQRTVPATGRSPARSSVLLSPATRSTRSSALSSASGPARSAPRSRARISARSAGLAVLLATLLLSATWQLAPHLHPLPQALLPFSESRELNQGLALLKHYDRPGSLAAAMAHFDRIVAHDANHAGAVAALSLAHSLRYAGDKQDEIWLQKADAGAQQALALNDQLALGHVAQGWVRDSQGKPALALTAFDHALRLDPANYFALHGKALALRHLRRYSDAMAHARQAMRLYPTEPVFSNELGTLHYEQGDYPAAEQAFRHSIAIEPDAVPAYANLNAALLRQNRSDEALQVLQQGLQVRPSAKLYGNLGNALFLRGDYVGAAAAFENAVSPSKGAPGEYLNWANLGDALRWIPGREDAARKAYQQAMHLLAPRLQRAPSDVTLASRMGLYAARAGATADADALIRKALQLAPANADVLFRAALGYELLGNRAGALDAILKARQAGYPEKFIEAEPDLVNLRRDPAYPLRD